MIGFLYRLLIGKFTSCDHKWEILKEKSVYNLADDGSYYNFPSYTKYVMRCDHCGEIKVKKG